jgi:hypothetical protein
VLGPSHKDTLRTVNNYSELLFRQNKFKEAEALAARAMRDREASKYHTRILGAMSNEVKLRIYWCGIVHQ